MSVGKKKCELLKNIRKEIALRYDISYTSDECSFKGECKGTCPKCVQEVKYLEEELTKRGLLDNSLFLPIFEEEFIRDSSSINNNDMNVEEQVVLMGEVEYNGGNEEDSNTIGNETSKSVIRDKIRQLRKNILSKFPETQGCVENDRIEGRD